MTNIAVIEQGVSSARLQAQMDWVKVGEFDSGQFEGEARQAYLQEAAKIMRQWDNQEV